MCGILVHFNPTTHLLSDKYVEVPESHSFSISKFLAVDSCPIVQQLIPKIMERGPDFYSLLSSGTHGMVWFSSVLSLRKPFTKQIVEVNSRYILQYNGELYNDDVNFNDTQYIADLLKGFPVKDVLRKLSGEFAYSIFDKHQNLLYFGRDRVGIRSLSYRLDENTGELYVCSLSGRIEGFKSCEAGVIYIYDTKACTMSTEEKLRNGSYTISIEQDNYTNLTHYVDILYQILYTAVYRRLTNIEPIRRKHANYVSLLFSGGLDCSIIAALICKQWRDKPGNTLELLNVAFENPRTKMQPNQAPDRLLAQKSASTLQTMFPTIDIKLVEIDVSYELYLQFKDVVIDLIYPKDTEMDLSIGIAFYFACKGKVYIENLNKCEAYQRRSIVVFSGLGADELYGGYHKFLNKSMGELGKELTKQINNIHDKNLDRDDKVISCHGVEARYPFLDEDVIEFSTQLPINYKVNKMILRELALKKLDLTEVSSQPKRAIQFGSRSAKITKDLNKHGTDKLK